eukprot:m51a1_g6887 hypothetical protein (190) ;mRNA; r:247779-248501
MRNGKLSAGLKEKWNNRRITWQWIESPNYSGDIKVGLFGGSKREWLGLVITHLPNGIHAVEMKQNGNWVKLSNLLDLGQVWIAQNADWSPMATVRFRVYDVNDKLVMGGREYEVDIPATEVKDKYSGPLAMRTYGGTDYVPSNSTTAHSSVHSVPLVIGSTDSEDFVPKSLAAAPAVSLAALLAAAPLH